MTLLQKKNKLRVKATHLRHFAGWAWVHVEAENFPITERNDPGTSC